MPDRSVRFMLEEGSKYSHIVEDESAEKLLQDDRPLASVEGPKRATTQLTILMTITVVFLACISSSLCGLWVGRRYPSDSGAIRHVSKYSPIMDDVHINFHTEKFNGTFVHENIYRQDAGPEVDAAWDALGIRCQSRPDLQHCTLLTCSQIDRNVIVPEKLAHKVGLREHDHMGINEKYGGGYPAFVEGLHQLHCLNLLRQALYYNYDYYHSRGKVAFSDPEDVQRWHVSMSRHFQLCCTSPC